MLLAQGFNENGVAPLVDESKGRVVDTGLFTVDGCDVEKVWNASNEAITRARNGEGPSYILAKCTHLEGHFLGDPLLRIARRPIKEMRPMTVPLLKSFFARKGTLMKKRTESVRTIASLIKDNVKLRFSKEGDPLEYTRKKLAGNETQLKQLEAEVKNEIQQAVEAALAPGQDK